MRKRTIQEPYVGQIWTTAEQEAFVITQITEAHDPWVHYEKIKTKQTYNCRLEAFTHRFHPVAE